MAEGGEDTEMETTEHEWKTKEKWSLTEWDKNWNLTALRGLNKLMYENHRPQTIDAVSVCLCGILSVKVLLICFIAFVIS